ncbi:hypothetical protein E4T44_08826 [Aureobasidium sp. EXF-8845]|nr:hypothetical protein E4T44_08826 [Aureobasidium sp. EXF-8845]KAI4843174.1 hypothetical protein E4T45_08736 [Aureobasidium sp. EXF-8846]
MVGTGQKKVYQTYDELCQIFTRVNADLGPGDICARGTVPLHPIGRWMGVEKWHSEQVFNLECIQIIRTKNWLELGLRKVGVCEYSVLQRLIAASMEYSVSDFEYLMKVFFVEWEKDLKPDGRTNRNKDQWIRWCEIHLIRHHRATKAVRCLDVLEALGLLYPGWWKQVYATKHNTAVYNDTYESPWDIRPNADSKSMEAVNVSYAQSEAQARASLPAAAPVAPSAVQPPTAITASPAQKNKQRKRIKTTKSIKSDRFQKNLDLINHEYDVFTADKDADIKSEIKSESTFRPEEFYPDYVHAYDAIMGVPATTNPQLAHTVAFAPGAEAWRNLDREGFEGATRFNPEINATRIIDSAAKDAVLPQTTPHVLPSGQSIPRANASQAPAPPGAYVNPFAQFMPSGLSLPPAIPVDQRRPRGPRYIPRTITPPPKPKSTVWQPAGVNWDEIDERDFVYALSEVEADFPPPGVVSKAIRKTFNDLPIDLVARQRKISNRNDLYKAVAEYKKVPAADLARRIAEREVEQQSEDGPKVRTDQWWPDSRLNKTFCSNVRVNPAMYPPGEVPDYEAISGGDNKNDA